MKAITIILLMISGIYLFSQNLVPNPDFENYGLCPEDFNPYPKKNLVKNWVMPTKGTADYFNRCSEKNAGVPKNFAGAIDAHSGDGYIGLILRDNFSENWLNDYTTGKLYREYAQAKLTSSLEAGKEYCIQLYYSLSGNSQYAVDRLGICVSKDEISAGHDGVIGSKAQISTAPGKIIKNKGKWTLLCGTYTANGGEEYITIGNFWLNDETKWEILESAGITKPLAQAYYYIDDVSVTEITDSKECECAKKVISQDVLPVIEKPATDFEKALEGETVILENIFFDIDKAELLPASYEELNKLLELLQKYPDMEIEISGHTSNTGTPEHNLDLSVRRANAVRDFLVWNKIEESRIISQGLGLTKPITTNDTPEGRSKNRRVEFKILKK